MCFNTSRVLMDIPETNKNNFSELFIIINHRAAEENVAAIRTRFYERAFFLCGCALGLSVHTACVYEHTHTALREGVNSRRAEWV